MTEHIHRRLTAKAARFILKAYDENKINRSTAMLQLGLKTNRFHNLLKKYRNNQEKFTIDYARVSTPHHLPKEIDSVIHSELEKEKSIINNPKISIRRFNFEAIRLEVIKRSKIKVSAKTIRNRAIKWNLYRPKSQPGPFRSVETTAIGYLIQHDSSHHFWSPFIPFKFYLILTVDDYSRKMLYAHFVPREDSWTHILAAQHVIATHGVGLAYYVDNHSIFRFIVRKRSNWQSQRLKTDEGFVQWKKAVERAGMTVWYAPKARAKGKVERKFRYLQDRIVRRCAKEEVKTIEEAQKVLDEEVYHYNCEHVHRETNEIPELRWQKAIKEGKTLFQPLRLKSKQSLKDIFCLKFERKVDHCGKVFFRGASILLPRLSRTRVTIHYRPDEEIRILYRENIVKVVKLKKR